MPEEYTDAAFGLRVVTFTGLKKVERYLLNGFRRFCIMTEKARAMCSR